MGKNKAGIVQDKTNAMRLLDAAGFVYQTHRVQTDTATSGMQVAALLGVQGARLFKTLVTQGKQNGYYVFIIPAQNELDLKKAALAVGEKSIMMLPERNLLPLTGYVHGGCSPIGMKKHFPTVLQESALTFDTIYFSAGKRGQQIEMNPRDLQNMLSLDVADVCKEYK